MSDDDAAVTDESGDTDPPAGVPGDGLHILPPPSQPMPAAHEFIADHYMHPEGHLLLRSWRGGFWQWRRSKWAEVEDRSVRKAAYRFTEDAVYMTLKGPEPWAPTRSKVLDLLDAVHAITFLHRDLQQPAWTENLDGVPSAHELVSVANGLLHIHTRKLYDHDPRLFNLTAVPFGYDHDAPEPARWLQFLDELWPDDPESIAALQEFFGYVLSGRTDQHKILLLVGPLRGGKGTIARVLKKLIGDGNYAGPTLSSLGTNFGLSPLIGKPLAVVSDARLGGPNTSQVVERLLSISGEDMLTIDVKYKEHWTGTLPTRFVIISNELPSFGDASGAIASRFITLVLNQSWLGRENTNLTNELLEELPGILSWALDGLDRLNERGRFTEPASSRDAIVLLKELVSPVSAFVRDRCEIGPYEEPCDTVYSAWTAWTEGTGNHPGSAQSFGRDLRAVVPGLNTIQPREGGKHERRWYRGLRLRPSGGHGGPERVPPRSRPSQRSSEHAGTRSNSLLSQQPAAGTRTSDDPDHGMEVAQARAAEVLRRRAARQGAHIDPDGDEPDSEPEMFDPPSDPKRHRR